MSDAASSSIDASTANDECVGPSSERAGTASGCDGCPNQKACAAGEGRKEDPDLLLIAQRLKDVKSPPAEGREEPSRAHHVVHPGVLRSHHRGAFAGGSPSVPQSSEVSPMYVVSPDEQPSAFRAVRSRTSPDVARYGKRGTSLSPSSSSGAPSPPPSSPSLSSPTSDAAAS